MRARKKFCILSRKCQFRLKIGIVGHFQDLRKTCTKLQVIGSHCPSIKVGKEYRDQSFEQKIMSDKGVILGVKQ